VATVTVPAVSAKVVVVAPCGTVTLDGMVAPAGDELRLTVAPPVRAADVSVTVHVDPAVGDTEVGLHARLCNAGVESIVTVAEFREIGIEVPVASAADPPLSWTVGDPVAVPAKVRVTVARTALGKGVVFNPQARHVDVPVPVVQESVLLAAPGPAVTVALEKSVVG